MPWLNLLFRVLVCGERLAAKIKPQFCDLLRSIPDCQRARNRPKIESPPAYGEMISVLIYASSPAGRYGFTAGGG
jgi:hypothetical protein